VGGEEEGGRKSKIRMVVGTSESMAAAISKTFHLTLHTTRPSPQLKKGKKKKKGKKVYSRKKKEEKEKAKDSDSRFFAATSLPSRSLHRPLAHSGEGGRKRERGRNPRASPNNFTRNLSPDFVRNHQLPQRAQAKEKKKERKGKGEDISKKRGGKKRGRKKMPNPLLPHTG